MLLFENHLSTKNLTVKCHEIQEHKKNYPLELIAHITYISTIVWLWWCGDDLILESCLYVIFHL